MVLKSIAFEGGKEIPQKYTCDGENIIPPFAISEVPDETKSLVLIMDDPDSYTGIWHHWVLWNISPDTKEIKEGKVPDGAEEGENSFHQNGYGGPCPKEGSHRYFFHLYALDTTLDIPHDTTKEELETEIVGHVIDKAEIFGTYKRE